jgi:heme-degrading monooxygenase HmoA
MMISITSSRLTATQTKLTEAFLQTFLPRLRKYPGVIAIYHFARPDQGDENTLVIWESEAALKAYRQSDLVKEAITFEKEHGLPSTREAYALISAL